MIKQIRGLRRSRVWLFAVIATLTALPCLSQAQELGDHQYTSEAIQAGLQGLFTGMCIVPWPAG